MTDSNRAQDLRDSPSTQGGLCREAALAVRRTGSLASCPMGRQQPQQPGNRTGSPTGAAGQTPGIDAPGPKAGAPTWLWGRLCPLREQIWRPHLGPSVPPPPGPNPHSANVASCPLPGSADLERGQWYTVVGVVRGLPAPVGSDQRPQSAWPLSPSGLQGQVSLGREKGPAPPGPHPHSAGGGSPPACNRPCL